MKTKILLFAFAFFYTLSMQATTHTITNSGFTFTPDEIQVNVGDTVIFTLASMHDAVEVDELVWDANGNSSNGGFSVPLGGGMIVMLTPGMHYYVCSVHAASGMKGKIEVHDVSLTVPIREEEETMFYPNPFKDELNVRLTKDIDILEITDVTGNTIYRASDLSSGQEHQISTAQLSSGVYFVISRKADEVIIRKLIKL